MNESSNSRRDLISPDRAIQISLRTLDANFKVGAHNHLRKSNLSLSPTEAWILFSGKISVRLYDLDNSLINTFNVTEFDLVIFHAGGHALDVLEGPVTFLEVKTGPYEGVENDKQAIC